MAVYVDHMFEHGDWGKWTSGGHMQADTLVKLHAMAAKLGLKRSWFQSKPGRPWHDHYDLTQGKRIQAIKLGAIPQTDRETVERNRLHRDRHHAAEERAEAFAAASIPQTF